MYGGLSAMFFFLVLFLQQVAGYDALQAGLATLPTTLVMFSLSRRAGRWPTASGRACSWACGPLVAAAGSRMLQRVDAHVDYVTELLPALLLFSLGLSATVAPLTATVLADADEHNAGSPRASTTRSRASPGCSPWPRSARSSPASSAPRSTSAWPAASSRRPPSAS